jgi:cell wall-associated NlpC family hydrolase
MRRRMDSTRASTRDSASPSFWLPCLAIALLLQACASSPYRHAPAPPPAPPQISTGNEIAMRAMSLIGRPYEFGGNGPTTFDCSGLVRYVHAQLGIVVPRTAADQYTAAKHVNMVSLEPGDLLFFRTSKGKRISHVAIYAGEGRFIHAPQTGRPVELRLLDDEFYRPRLAGAGRLF